MLIFGTNLSTAFVALLLISSKWGIEEYGIYAAFVANAYLLIQFISLGNANALVSDLANSSSLQDHEHGILWHYFRQTFRRSFLVCIWALCIFLIFRELLPESLLSSGFYLFPFSFIGSVNKTLTFFFTTRHRFSTYARISYARNALLILAIAITNFSDNFDILFALLVLIEAIIFIGLFVLSGLSSRSARANTGQIGPQHLKRFFALSANSFFFEVFPKIDFLVMQFVASATFLGTYALISSVNEACNALFMQYRTQMTPLLSQRMRSAARYEAISFRSLYLMLMLVMIAGFSYFFILSNAFNTLSIDLIIVLFFVFLRNVILARPFVLGFIHQQFGREGRGAFILYSYLLATLGIFALTFSHDFILQGWCLALIFSAIFRILYFRDISRLVSIND